jgi:hypothetical protein
MNNDKAERKNAYSYFLTDATILFPVAPDLETLSLFAFAFLNFADEISLMVTPHTKTPEKTLL